MSWGTTTGSDKSTRNNAESTSSQSTQDSPTAGKRPEKARHFSQPRGYGLSCFAPKKDSKKRELERLEKSNEYEQERKQLQSTVPSMILKVLNSFSLTTIDRLLDLLIDGSIDWSIESIDQATWPRSRPTATDSSLHFLLCPCSIFSFLLLVRPCPRGEPSILLKEVKNRLCRWEARCPLLPWSFY